METYKVYAHINKINNKAYIGITKQPLTNRWGLNGQGYKAQPKFYNAITKYGWNNFTHIILEDNILDEELARELETYYISEYDSIQNGYNILPEGIASYPHFKPVYCITTNIKYDSIKEAAQATQSTSTDIIENCKGKRGPVKGLQWTYWDVKNNQPAEIIPFVAKEQPNKTRIYCAENNTYYESINEACRILAIDKRSLQRALNGKRIGVQGKHFVRENEMEKLLDIITQDTGKTKRVYCEEIDQIFNSQQEAAIFCGKTPQSVMKNCQGKIKKCGNYHFHYVETMPPEQILTYYQSRRIEEDEI